MENNKIIACIATYPERIKTFKDTIDSIIEQVDVLRVYLNEYTEIPDFLLNNEKIKVFLGKDFDGDIKAKGKFYGIDEINGYVFTIDDDLIYPKDYVETMMSYVDKFNKEGIITIHGKTINNNPKDYYRNYGKSFRFQDEKNEVTNIHIPGSGVMVFHTDKIKINYENIKNGSYVDLFIGLESQINNYPVFIIPHKKNWVRGNKKNHPRRNLYFQNLNKGKDQTTLLRSIKWKIIK